MNRQSTTQTLQQKPTTTPTSGGLLQRKCACGNHTMAGGECAECSKTKRIGLQTKLKVNEPGDIYEQEADRIADQVMATPEHHAVSGIPQRIQRFAGQATGQADTAPASVDRVLASPGHRLDPALRQDMGQRFGHDFSRVHVHSGAAAEQSAREVDANAYTVGHNIVFGAGRFAPGTHEGRRLIAHKLAHVVQQSAADGSRVDQSDDKRGLSPIAPLAPLLLPIAQNVVALTIQPKLIINEDRYERQADRVADQVMRMPGPKLQRQVDKEEEEEFLQTKSLVQRRVSGGEGGSEAPPIVHEVLRSPGQPLDPQTRSFMESRFGHAFSQVRVHTDAKAARSARAVNALAYTVGRDIVFGGGQYTPQAGSGRHLLAHELAHVVQQTSDPGLRDQQGGLGHTSTAAPGASPSESRELPPASPISVQHHSMGLRLSRQNIQQTTNVLSQGAVASVQFIVDGTMNSTRVGPVSQQKDVSVIIGRLTTIRSLAQQLLPLWNTATPFTPPGGAAPIAFAPLTVDELAKGLLVFNRYRLAIPPAANPPVMTNWKIGMRFPLPIRIDAATNEGVLHPDPIRSMAGTFDAAWAHLLNELPAVLPAQPGATLQQSVTDFLTNRPTTLARGIHLGARAVANAQDSQEFVLEVFNQVGAGAFDLALAFMDYLVNQDIGILSPQTAGAAILNRIRLLLAAPPAALPAAQQTSLNRANGMLGRVVGVQPLPDPCIPNRKLTWNNFTGAVPAGAAANTEAATHFRIDQVAFQANQLFQAVLNQGASWVRPRSRQPGNLAVNGCQPDINACEAFFNGLPAGAVGAHWGLPGGPAVGCPAAIVPGAVTANNIGECSTVIGAACTSAREADSQTRLLPHEQLHFDIPCVLVHKANAARASGAAVTLAAVRVRGNTLTGQYDAQTNHGCNAAAQALWDANVAAGLPAQRFP